MLYLLLTITSRKNMKSIIKIIPRLQLFSLAVVLLFWVVQTVLRLAFWVRFHQPSDPVPGKDLLEAFYLGLKYDLRVAIFVAIPILLLGWIKPFHPVYSRFGRRLWLGYASILLFMLLLFYAFDFGYYAYLQTRINATALRFLYNLKTSALMVWESYPVIVSFLALLVATAAGTYVLSKASARITPMPEQYNRWYKKTAVVIITFFLTIFLAYGKWAWFPLRWSDAFFSPQPFTGQLASNPILYFFDTMKNRGDSYKLAEVQKAYPLMAHYLGVKNPDVNTLNFRRDYHFDKDPNTKPINVVLVFLESFASYKSTLENNPLDTTPAMQSLADNGYFWKNYFSPQTGTARSVWALVTGSPDVEKNKTSSRNPLIVHQHTIINDFKDYKKFYFIGGSASWANIRGLLAGNIPGIDILGELDYTRPRVDVWGVSDMSLFEEANERFAKLNKPFVAIIQTSGNHRPYTIPDDHGDFKIWKASDLPGKVTKYGFASMEELNSFRFLDYSVGHFIKIAKKEPYFKHTVFVFYGDHGIHAPTGDHVPKSEAQLRIQGLRVPLVMYGPGVIKTPRVFDEVASEMDVLPTVAELTRTDYVDTTIGRSLLDPEFNDRRDAFTIEHHGTRTIGLLSKDFYLQMPYYGGKATLHDLHSDHARDDVSAQHPELAASQAKLLQSMRATVQYMREHNPNLENSTTKVSTETDNQQK